MKSFKKLAIAMVAAMTTASMLATPASAAPMTVALTVNGAAPLTAGTSTATAIQLAVPANNSITVANALKLIATVDTGTSVTVTTTNATIVTDLATLAAPVTASSGSATLTISTGTGDKATFYVYTKTTAVGTVVVSNQGTTFTYYVQGQAGLINKLAVAAPTAAPASTQQVVTVTATDVFGNKISGKSVSARVFGAQGTLDSPTALTGATLADFGVATFKLTLPATGRSLVEFSVTNAGDAASAVVGLEVPALTPYAEITVRDLAAELAAEKAARATDKAAADAAALKAAADLAAANAEIAKLKVDSAKALADATAAHTAELAKVKADNAAELAKVKADNDAAIKALKDAFNALAKKWNAKNPKAKVTLVK